jgi:glycosyltransferase involved in cell wall biosynthesis
LLGDGPLRARWLERIAELDIGDRIRLPGHADSSEVTRHLCAADWFIHTALRDPSPLVIVEATVAGLPMAVSIQTGNGPEAVAEGKNGFTFDPMDTASLTDAVRRIVTSSPAERDRMARESERVAGQRFDPDVIIDRFYQGLLQQDSRTA